MMGWHYTRLFSNAFGGFKSKISSLPNKKGKIALLGSLGCAIYAVDSETVPYTSRRHLVLASSSLETRLGGWLFERAKSGKFPISPGKGLSEWLIELAKSRKLRGETILPASHPDDVRVQKIGKDIIEATCRELGKDRHRRAQTAHVVEFNWEVVVVDDPVDNACCFPGGKIVVNTGVLRASRSDDEVAATIGHEVAHAVARHYVEFDVLDLVPMIILHPLLPRMPTTISWLSLSVAAVLQHFIGLSLSRRNEREADYIGLLLSASAGYDPRIGFKAVFKNQKRQMETRTWQKFLEYISSTHPPDEERAQLLSQPKVMEEALFLYKEALSQRKETRVGLLKRICKFILFQ